MEDNEPTEQLIKNLREGYDWEKGELTRVGRIWVGFVGRLGLEWQVRPDGGLVCWWQGNCPSKRGGSVVGPAQERSQAGAKLSLLCASLKQK